MDTIGEIGGNAPEKIRGVLISTSRGDFETKPDAEP
jgi:hypothetical protein